MSGHVLRVWSNAFQEGDWIPNRYSARGDDVSPDIQLEGIHPSAQSIAITLDDASHPLFPNYNHWLIWNLPVQNVIPEAVPHGKLVESLEGAMQGIGYGRHRYKGPKPPFKAIHTYVLTVYILDCKCELSFKSKKSDLLEKIEGHILQQETLSGKFQSNRE